ncbi:hypothetical protein MVLG_05572 [Microbotryum lychnidis-dioicae p1A1 Lamole]|nr:hypothetical protein MVLG_05572 [Microbotryum lychnidis-dioicae p1A1 Lamole]|eukprot:KDE04003.1 hypothetical protein MVLG_05572 [Microbotryum lychnidis-dioicae p1A1 Lamole]
MSGQIQGVPASSSITTKFDANSHAGQNKMSEGFKQGAVSMVGSYLKSQAIFSEGAGRSPGNEDYGHDGSREE